MALDIRRAGDADYPKRIRLLVAGPPGSGKTLFASTAPNVLYVNAEGGMMSVVDRQPHVLDLRNSGQLMELRMALDQEPDVQEKIIGTPVDTVVLDTIDEIARILVRERLESTKKDVLAIQDWGWLGDQLRGIVRGFRNLDINLIINVHLKTSEDSESGRTIVSPAIQGAMGDEIPGYVDLAVKLVARSMTKMVDGQGIREVVRYFQTYPDIQHPWIKDRSGKLPLEFPVNFSDDWKRLDAMIYGPSTVVPPEQQVVVPVQVPSSLAATAAPAIEKEAALLEPSRVPESERASTDVQAPAETPQPVVVDTPSGAVDTTTGEIVAPERPLPPAEDDPHPPVKEPKQPKAAKPVDEGPPWTCAACGNEFDNPDQRDLSLIRFRKPLCNPCFVEAKKKR